MINHPDVSRSVGRFLRTYISLMNQRFIKRLLIRIFRLQYVFRINSNFSGQYFCLSTKEIFSRETPNQHLKILEFHAVKFQIQGMDLLLLPMVVARILLTVGFFECEECNFQWYDFGINWEDEQTCYGRRRKNRICNALVSPFDVTKKCFGFFRCNDCDRNWASAHCYAEHFQKCKECHTPIQAHKMKPLGYGLGKNRNEAHHQSSCERCIYLRRPCTKSAV